MGERESFYLFLPGSVPSGPILNRLSHYITMLPTSIMLSTAHKHEVAVVQFVYPTSCHNIWDGILIYFSYLLGIEMSVRIPSGIYLNSKEVIEAFKRALGPDAMYYVMTADTESHRFVMEMKPPASFSQAPYIEWSDNLTMITGFDTVIQHIGNNVSVRTWDLSGGIQIQYIYCSLVENTNVGHKVVPLVAVVPYEKAIGSFGDQVLFEPKNPQYFPLQELNILSQIEIVIRLQSGDYVPYTNGDVIVVLHVRRVQPNF